MASPSELSLDCKPHTYSMLLKSFGEQTTSDQTYKQLEEILSRLEEERLKIDAFKRELPLCMQLLTNAMEASRQQLQAFRGSQGSRPVLEEFIPLKNPTSYESSDQKPSNISDKANWMTSAQLWSQASEAIKPQSITITSPKEAADNNIGFNISPNRLPLIDNKHRNGGGAFLPFSKDRNSSHASALRPLPELALASSENEMDDKRCSEPDNGPKRENSGKGNNGGVVIDQGKGTSEPQTTSNGAATTTTQTHRKARRCWSPDLHRRFVNALQMLGGSQVATPKQIRELMKVDGLTNDEVKSHLQKYRLHTRRPSPSPHAAGAPAPQLVVLGGIWVPPEYATSAASAGPALYGPHTTSHAPPPHYCTATPVPHQDFYTAVLPQAPLPPQTHHHHLHMYKATAHTQSSPECDVRGGGERSESIEDGKSDSGSWKGESGENEGERKGLAALREDGEESNGSDITLKF